MESIGQILRSGREARGLSLEDVHDATRITAQNLTALEEDRFDYFPNRVYSRAFLRDYSNFLGLDSASLLTRYEEEWNPEPEEAAAPTAGTSAWRALGYAALVLVIMAGLSAAGYFGWNYYEKQKRVSAKPPVRAGHREGRATLPSPPKPAQPEPTTKPETPKPTTPTTTPTAPATTPATTPEKPAPPSQPAAETGKQVLDVTALQDVWVRIKADGKTVFQGVIRAGETRSYPADKNVGIRAGMAGAVRLKFNGKPQPSLGTLKEVGDAVYPQGSSVE